ncbi:DUF262 domain-containing protein [uncultured Dokdonia sp.]|uniref:DUF262 domain-containing protein n=1 Tax=uncultured Dokdonia sp. TaxID=575653 RepID=UPI002639E44D|nr:DUF262 domain-containing protein [uncultured Dokdonia sp.]
MFKILKLGEMEPLSVGTFHKIQDKIDFFPIYQRYGGIWSNERKRLLIDTIINGFDIPKFYFNYFVEANNILNPKGFSYAVIDGKQRLQTILDYLNDKFSLSDNFVFYEDSNINLSNLRFSELSNRHPTIASSIEEYILDIVYVVTDEEDKLEELFLRLNGGYALTNAEKRNAIGGHLNREIREIVENHSFFQQKIRFKNPRYQHQDLLTRILFVESNNELVSLTNNVLDVFVRAHQYESQDCGDLIAKTISELDKFVEAFEDKDVLLRGKGIIPVYYFFISRFNPNLTTIRKFIEQFEQIRTENRSLPDEEQISILIEFDRWNQQGVHREKSLNERLEIIIRFYSKFEEDGSISIETNVLLNDFELDNEEELI